MPNLLGTILVVDDDALNRDMLSRRLVRKGYDVEMAEDGRQAIAKVEGGDFDLILLDVMMPVMNGLEALAELRKTLSPSDLPIIMATAKDRSEDVVEALKLGANDYVTKPLDFPVVLARVESQVALRRAMARVRLMERSLAERNRALEAINERMSKDLRAAARVQSALLPQELPVVPGLAFAWSFRPCDELAGDALGIVRLDDHRAGLYVLDVSGHGVASALLSVSLARALSTPGDPASILVRRDPGGPVTLAPAEVADRLGALYPFDTTTEQFFTLCYGVVDGASGDFRYASAGHPGPVVVPDAGPATLLEGRGFPVGLSDAPYDERRASLQPGDRVYIYSDGVPEAMGPDRALFGNDRLLASAERLRGSTLAEAVAALRSEVEAWAGDDHIRDDISILAFDYRGPAPSA